MKKFKVVIGAVLLLLALSSLFVGGWFISIPVGTDDRGIETFGRSQDGREIIGKVRLERRVHPLSVEGFFRISSSQYTYLYERKGENETKLYFLDEPLDYGWKLITPVIPIENSEKWAAFQVLDMTRMHARLLMYVFDKKGIQNVVEIKEVVRTSHTDQKNTEHFSISQSPKGQLMINTANGAVVYDQNLDRFVRAEGDGDGASN